MSERAIDHENVAATYTLIRPYIRRTPIIDLCGDDYGLNGVTISLKLELLQYSGSFKVRGAFANLLGREIPKAGVVAASGGNHGAAVAYAAMKLGIPAKIFVPRTASPAKLERLREYGAIFTVVGEDYGDALIASQAWASETGALRIHAFDQLETVLGQGTVGAELQEQAPTMDTILVAVGGGGLIAGISAWYEGKVKIVGVEPAAAPTLYRALEAGRPVDAEVGGVAADSLGPRRVGEILFPVAQRLVDRVILVTDEEILKAQKALWDSVRIACETGGAAAFAALLSHRYQPQSGERVGVVVCGGNTTAVALAK